jgi:hypothetical protein
MMNISFNDWEPLSLACLALASKLNEFSFSGIINESEDPAAVIQMEEAILRTLQFQLPIPLFFTKEVILFQKFMSLVYSKKPIQSSVVGPSPYQNFYLAQFCSAVANIDPVLIKANRNDLVQMIVYLFFPQIRLNPNSKKLLSRFKDTFENYRGFLQNEDLQFNLHF